MRCPACGKRFVSRTYMLLHATSWRSCRRELGAERVNQLKAEIDRELLAEPELLPYF